MTLKQSARENGGLNKGEVIDHSFLPYRFYHEVKCKKRAGLNEQFYS
jgi:hypothetical protein